jgi:cephalosporin hydroxylase
MFRRAALVIRCVRNYGARATWIALRAIQHGAIQKVEEFSSLVRLVSQREPSVVLEIGTHEGGTYWAWCQVASSTAKVVSIDFPGSEKVSARLRSYLRPTQTETLIRADSHDPHTVGSVDVLRGSVDLLFIDGDHGYEGVRADFENYAPLVKPGGLIAFHDVVLNDDPTSQVDRLWKQLRDLYDVRELIADDAHGWGGIGVLHWNGDEDLAKWVSAPRGGSEVATPAGYREPA